MSHVTDAAVAPGTTSEPTASVREWKDFLPPAVLWRIGLTAALLGVLYHHELYRLGYVWWHKGDWSHGWLVPLFSLYFVYISKSRLFAAQIRPNLLGALVLVGALLLYFASIWPLGMGYPKSLSLVLAIGGVVFWLCGWEVLKICAFPIGYLLLAMPLPEGIYVRLTMPLRMFATKVTTVLLQVAVPGLDVAPSGTVIDYLYMGVPGRLNVAEACSGMRSLIGLSALGVAIAFLTPRPGYQRLILLVACLPIGIFCNIIRVFITSLLQVFGQHELSRGTAHSLLGLVTFILALSLFSLLGYVMSNLFLDDPEDDAENEPEPSA